MLIERRLDMKLVTALIVCRGIHQIKCHADRARNFGSGLRTEEGISPLDIEARPVETHYGKTVGSIVSGRGETRESHIPMMLARFPAETCVIGAISDGDSRIRPVELAIEPQRANEGYRCGIGVGADRNQGAEAERAAENLDIGKPGGCRDIRNEIDLYSRRRDVTEWEIAVRARAGGIEINVSEKYTPGGGV